MIDAFPVDGPEDPRRWIMELPETLEGRFWDEPRPGRMLIAPKKEKKEKGSLSHGSRPGGWAGRNAAHDIRTGSNPDRK